MFSETILQKLDLHIFTYEIKKMAGTWRQNEVLLQTAKVKTRRMEIRKAMGGVLKVHFIYENLITKPSTP